MERHRPNRAETGAQWPPWYHEAMAFLPRLHLFEFNDQPWIPDILRRQLTGFIQTLLVKTIQHNAFMEKKFTNLIATGLSATDSNQIVDLCAGGGGPWLALQPTVEAAMQQPVYVRLTDKFPNINAFIQSTNALPERIGFSVQPVDATDVSGALKGVRTLFDALHHFRPDSAAAILKDAVTHQEPIIVFEAPARHPLHLLQMLFGLPFTVLLLTPFIRPFEWSWLVLTYLIPLSVLMIVWDGFVSCLRAYTPAELLDLARRADPDDKFDWESGSFLPGYIGAIYLIGTPKSAE